MLLTTTFGFILGRLHTSLDVGLGPSRAWLLGGAEALPRAVAVGPLDSEVWHWLFLSL